MKRHRTECPGKTRKRNTGTVLTSTRSPRRWHVSERAPEPAVVTADLPATPMEPMHGIRLPGVSTGDQ